VAWEVVSKGFWTRFDRDHAGNWVHVSGCRADSDCVFYQEGKGKFDFKASETKSADVKP